MLECRFNKTTHHGSQWFAGRFWAILHLDLDHFSGFLSLFLHESVSSHNYGRDDGMMTWCVVLLLKRHSSIVRLLGRYVQARSAIPSSALSSQGGARDKLSCPRHDTWG